MKKILLVEDDKSLAEIITDILLIHGYIVDVADTGDKGRQSLFSYKPDIVISDVSMPGMNGIDLVQLIRKDPLHKSVPVILLSARTTIKDIQNGRDAGADIYLTKPCKAEDLVSSVSRLL